MDPTLAPDAHGFGSAADIRERAHGGHILRNFGQRLSRLTTDTYSWNMSGRIRALLLIFVCGLSLAAQLEGAEQPAFSPKSVVVPKISGRIELDGRLDDTEWQEAVKITDFQQFSPGNGEPPSEPTEFLLALDDDNLYVAVRFIDSDPAGIKRSQLVQGQGVFNDDYAQILLDTFNDRRTGYIFYVNPNGVQRDGLLLGGLSYNMDWDGIWQAASSVNDSGWQAEIAIPFKTLSFDRNADTWGINLIRSIRRKREEVAWSQRDRRITLDVSGELRGMRGREQGRGLDLVPSASISERENFIANSSSVIIKPSLDAFWRITPSLVGALTLNTDFSATDVDDRQVNLTRFSLFFPEKRDFFLEDSEIFEFGGLTQNGRPFFSRTIGLSATGQPIDLEAGARLTGKIGRNSLGVLAVRQESAGSFEAENVFVARGYRSFGEQSTIGGIITSGDPSGSGNNTLYGVDLALRDQRRYGGLVEARAWMQQSSTPGRKGDEAAWGASLAWPNDRIEALLSYTEIGRDFRPALGFANRTGISEFLASYSYRHRFEKGGLLRSWRHGVEASEIRDDAGGLESRRFVIMPFSLDNQPGDILSMGLERQTEVIRRPFVLPGGVRVPVGRYDFDRVRLYGQTAGFRPMAFNWDFGAGDFYDGTRGDARVGINWRPNRHWALGTTFQTNRLELQSGDFTTRVWSMNANYAFNVRWAWLNVAQYDNVSKRIGLNSRLRWWPAQGQVAYLVVNYDWREDARGDFQPFLAETTVKFTYTFRY